MNRTGLLVATLIVVVAANASAKKKKKKSVEVEAMVQTRLTWESETTSDSTTLSLPRARIALEGRLHKKLHYDVSLDFGGFEFEVLNAYLDVRAYKSDLIVRVGHFKRPFGRQRLTTAARQGLVERTFIKKRRHFGAGRDLGLMLHNDLKRGSGLEWAFGLFADIDAESVFERTLQKKVTGNDVGLSDPFRFRPTLGGRVGYHMKGLRGYEETDRDRTGPRVGGGIGVIALLTEESTSERVGIRWEADVIAKMWGLTLSAAVLGRAEDQASGFEHQALGIYSHAGYRFGFFPALEVAARYAGLFEEVASTSHEHHEVSWGLNGYLFNDHLKLQLDASWLSNYEAGAPYEKDAYRFRFQIQVK